MHNCQRHKKRASQNSSSENSHCNAGRDRKAVIRMEEIACCRLSVVLSLAESWQLRAETFFMDRIATLTEILTANPGDSFARYGLAMEHSKAGQIEQALQEFRTLIEKNPDYTPAYFMAAQALVSASRVDEAKRWLVDGVSSARRTGNAHAQSEMTAMLEELG